MSACDSIHDVLLALCAGKRSHESAEDGDVIQNASKHTKLDDDGQNDVSLKEMQFTRILCVSPNSKRICIECVYQDKPAVVVLEKTAFEQELAEKIVVNFRYCQIVSIINNHLNIFLFQWCVQN